MQVIPMDVPAYLVPFNTFVYIVKVNVPIPQLPIDNEAKSHHQRIYLLFIGNTCAMFILTATQANGYPKMHLILYI